jgi:hypothetical protein
MGEAKRRRISFMPVAQEAPQSTEPIPPPTVEEPPAMRNKTAPDTDERMAAPLSASLPPSTPTQTLELMRLDFRLPGSGGGLTVKERSRNEGYVNRFPQHCAQDVNIAFHVRNLLYKQQDRTYQAEMRYYNPDGFLMGRLEHSDWVFKADKDWSGIYTKSVHIRLVQ